MAKKRKRSWEKIKERVTSEGRMVLEGKEVIQAVKCRHGERDKGVGNNEDKTWLRNTSGRGNHERKRGMRRFSLFPDADQASPLNFHSVVSSRDVTALFFLVIRDRNRRNCDESNFPRCTSRRNVSRANSNYLFALFYRLEQT